MSHDPVEILERDALGGAVGAVVHARGPAAVILAEIALRRDIQDLPALLRRDGDDVSPGAPVGAVAAADAGVADDHLEPRSEARDGARRAADHAHRVGAVITGGGDEEVLVFRAFPDEPR